MEETKNSKDIILELGKRFHSRYAKRFADLNKGIIRSLDEGGYFVPTITLDGGGLLDNSTEPFPEVTGLMGEKNVARVIKKSSKVTALETKYTVRIPWADVEETHNNEEYFNLYFDSVIDSVVKNYIEKHGPANKVRYGDNFIDYVGPHGEVFRYDGSGDHLDLIFSGKWAKNG